MPKRVVGRKMYGGQTQYMPLKSELRGRDADQFSLSPCSFSRPRSSAYVGKNSPVAARIVGALNNGWPHYLVLAAMISFSVISGSPPNFNRRRSRTISRNTAGYIPGVRPGKPTADFLDYTMTRLTFAGAIFLTMIAILPLS